MRVSDVDEPAVVAEALQRFGELEPADVALLLARAKAEDVASHCDDDVVVLGCDSVLEIDGVAYGKPETPDVARSRWQLMRGRRGELHSGHWIVDLRTHGSNATFGVTASTTVEFADIDDAEIDSYVATGEPLAVAGAFTIDGLGGAYVDRIEGDPHNVVGVSLPVLRAMLAEIGIPWREVRVGRP